VATPVPAITGRGDRPFAEVLGELAPTPARPRPAGLITPQLRARVPDLDRLAATLGAARLPADPVAAARQLRDAAATLFACGRFDDGARFTLLHAVTGMDAVLAIAEATPTAAAEGLVGHAAVALAAMVVAFGGPIAATPVTPATRPVPEQLAAAAATLDDHAIKLAATVAAARADRAPSDHYDAALARWLAALGERAG
jgi:hypothetical protein